MISLIKHIFRKKNLLFLIGSFALSVIIMSAYGRLAGEFLTGGYALIIAAISVVLSIFVSGWILGFKPTKSKKIPRIEYYGMAIIILIIVIFLQKYYPHILFGANTILEPSREFLMDTGRRLIIK